jgi:hypothetical protein
MVPNLPGRGKLNALVGQPTSFLEDKSRIPTKVGFVFYGESAAMRLSAPGAENFNESGPEIA